MTRPRFSTGPVGLGPDDDRILETAPPRMLRWQRVLLGFMRVVALAWLVKGLLAWAAILGLTPTAFEGRPSGFQATIIYFAVIDLVAAIGMWLGSNWGGVLWLLAVMSNLILAVFFPRFVSNGPVLAALLIVSTMVYLILSWLASVEE